MRLVKAELVKRNTADGCDFVEDFVPLGKVYYVDLDSIREEEWDRTDHVVTTVKRTTINTYSDPAHGKPRRAGVYPLELLKILPDA